MQIVEIALHIMQLETPVEFDWFYMKPYTTLSFFGTFVFNAVIFSGVVLILMFKGLYGEF